MKLWKAAVAALAMVAGSTPAWAVYTIQVRETAAGVVVTGRGSLDLSRLTLASTGFAGGGITPSQGRIIVGGSTPSTTAIDIYDGLGSTNFGTGGSANPTSSTGAFVGVIGSSRALFIQQGYVSGTDLGTSVTTFAGQTFDSLGLRLGGYGITLGTPDNQIQIAIGNPPAGVPEPAMWGLMLAGFGIVGAGLRTRRRSASFA